MSELRTRTRQEFNNLAVSAVVLACTAFATIFLAPSPALKTSGLVLLVGIGVGLIWAGVHHQHRFMIAGGFIIIVVELLVRFDPRVYADLGLLLLVVPAISLGVIHYLHIKRAQSPPKNDRSESQPAANRLD